MNIQFPSEEDIQRVDALLNKQVNMGKHLREELKTLVIGEVESKLAPIKSNISEIERTSNEARAITRHAKAELDVLREQVETLQQMASGNDRSLGEYLVALTVIRDRVEAVNQGAENALRVFIEKTESDIRDLGEVLSKNHKESVQLIDESSVRATEGDASIRGEMRSVELREGAAREHVEGRIMEAISDQMLSIDTAVRKREARLFWLVVGALLLSIYGILMRGWH